MCRGVCRGKVWLGEEASKLKAEKPKATRLTMGLTKGSRLSTPITLHRIFSASGW